MKRVDGQTCGLLTKREVFNTKEALNIEKSSIEISRGNSSYISISLDLDLTLVNGQTYGLVTHREMFNRRRIY